MVVKISTDRPMVACYRPGDVPMIEDPDNPGTLIPDDTWLITQDDTPVDGKYTEKEMRLLTHPLYANWEGPDGDGAYLALANVGLFFEPTKPPLVPDIMLSVRVTEPTPLKGQRIVQSYFVWRYKKLPEVVIEVVSNRKGGEDTRKLKSYAQIGIRWYVIFDPEKKLSEEVLRIYKLRNGRLQRTQTWFFKEVGLGLTLWSGDFEKRHSDRWLRWCDKDGTPIPCGEETAQAERSHAKRERRRADQEKHRADQEKHRADQEKHRADQEKRLREKLAAKLRALGVDPTVDDD
jgi:hypothetical protein